MLSTITKLKYFKNPISSKKPSSMTSIPINPSTSKPQEQNPPTSQKLNKPSILQSSKPNWTIKPSKKDNKNSKSSKFLPESFQTQPSPLTTENRPSKTTAEEHPIKISKHLTSCPIKATIIPKMFNLTILPWSKLETSNLNHIYHANLSNNLCPFINPMKINNQLKSRHFHFKSQT